MDKVDNQPALEQAFYELMQLLHKRDLSVFDLQSLQVSTNNICALLRVTTPALAKKYEVALRDAISLLESTEMDLADHLDELKLSMEKHSSQ